MPIRQTPIDTLEEGQYADSVYHVRRRAVATSKAGKPFLTVTLADKTGEITGRVFKNADFFADLFTEGDFIYVQGRTQTYEGKLQLVIDTLERVAPTEVEAKDFLPTSRRDPKELKRHMRRVLDSIGDEHVRALCVRAVFETPEGELFCRAPAAQGMHHAHLHGLLEHTLSVLILLDTVSRHYPNVNRDMLLAGGLFHDFGKIYELDFELAIGYSDRGRMVPHLIIGVQIIDRLIAEIPGFPEEARLQLEHIILAHHGTREFGSPVEPRTVEAMIIHQIEDMDAKVFAFLNHIEKAGPDATWTDKHFMLGVPLRRTTNAKQELYTYRLPDLEEAEARQPSLFGKK